METGDTSFATQQFAVGSGSASAHAAAQPGTPATVEERPTKKSKAEVPVNTQAKDHHQHALKAPAQSSPTSAPAPESILTSNALLSARLKKEIKGIWATAHCSRDAAPTTSSSTTSGSVDAVIPPFKVGTLEMYRRFPQAYDLLMQHHNCSAVQSFLLNDIMKRIEHTASASAVSLSSNALPWLRVADFGCGTGRIETMVAQHKRVRAIYAYDSELAMLKQCLLNTVRTAAESGHYGEVTLSPVASTDATFVASAATSSSPLNAPVQLCTIDTDGDGKQNSEHGADEFPRDSAASLELCIRPVPFQSIENGFLATTHHPRCHLITCAWSLSYVMRMQWGEDRWHAAVDATVQAMLDHLDNTASDAALVILETLGNGSTEPTRQNTYTQRLEEHFGFTRTWVRTDYEFATRVEAERMVRFFFGEKMLAKLTMDEDGVRCRLMECTGIWTLWKTKQE